MTEKCKKQLSRSYQGLSPLTKEVKTLIKPVLQKHGFVSSDILTQWHALVGEDLAKGIVPDKLTFPPGERGNGTLHVKSAGGAFALLFQHQQSYILSKINTFLGYEAVKNIRIQQGALPFQMPPCFTPAPKEESVPENVKKITAAVHDEELQDILDRIGTLIHSKR